MKYEDEYVEWLYVNRPIFNGDSLIHYLENKPTYEEFLSEMGLVDE